MIVKCEGFDIEIEPDKLQSRCAICGKPFEYWPKKDQVEQLDSGHFAHSECVNTGAAA